MQNYKQIIAYVEDMVILATCRRRLKNVMKNMAKKDETRQIGNKQKQNKVHDMIKNRHTQK